MGGWREKRGRERGGGWWRGKRTKGKSLFGRLLHVICRQRSHHEEVKERLCEAQQERGVSVAVTCDHMMQRLKPEQHLNKPVSKPETRS